MADRTRSLKLDASGFGSIVVPPGFLTAHESIGTAGVVPESSAGGGAYTIIRRGIPLDTGGTATKSYTHGTEIFVGGSVTVAGQPFDTVLLYFDFSS